MKRPILIALAICFCALPAFGQTGHAGNITWKLSVDDTAANCPVATPAPCSYTVLRAPAACSSATTGNFVVIGTSANQTTSFTDNTLGIGNWCYEMVFSVNGVASIDSNTAGGTVKPLPPSITVSLQ